MKQDTNTITQSVIDYFNISKFCMNKVRKLAMKFSYLILRKIVKIVATSGQILRQKMHRNSILAVAPDGPRWGAYSAPPDPLAGC